MALLIFKELVIPINVTLLSEIKLCLYLYVCSNLNKCLVIRITFDSHYTDIVNLQQYFVFSFKHSEPGGFCYFLNSLSFLLYSVIHSYIPLSHFTFNFIISYKIWINLFFIKMHVHFDKWKSIKLIENPILISINLCKFIFLKCTYNLIKRRFI